MPPAQVADAPPMMPADDLCRRCRYPLVGLGDRSACPECGLLAGFSRSSGDQLPAAHRSWLSRLATAALLTAAAMLAAPVAVWIATAAIIQDLPLVGRAAVDQILWLFVGLAPLVAIAAGAFMLTSRQPQRPAAAGKPSARTVRRVALLTPIFFAVVMPAHIWLLSRPFLSPDWRGRWIEILSILLFVGTPLSAVPLAILGFRYLRRLAERAPAPLLAGDSGKFGYWLAAALAGPGLLMLNVYATTTFDPGFTRPELYLFVLILLLAFSGTTYLWGIYLLVRYAIAFWWAHRQAAVLMRQADASLNASLVA